VFKAIATIQWPAIISKNCESGHDIPFLHTLDQPRLIERMRFRALLQKNIPLYKCTNYELSADNIVEVIERTVDEGKKEFSPLFVIESIRLVVDVFSRIGKPEIRFENTGYALSLSKKKIFEYVRLVEQQLDCGKDPLTIALCAKCLGILFSDPVIHSRASHSTINKLIQQLTKKTTSYSKYLVSNCLWCIYMLSISPSISVYENIYTSGNANVVSNLQYMLEIPGLAVHDFDFSASMEVENELSVLQNTLDSGFMRLMIFLFHHYENDPDVLAKLFRMVANITCIQGFLDNELSEIFVRKALRTLDKHQAHVDAQSKCLALFVNVHSLYPDYSIQFVRKAIRGAQSFPEDAYLQGKFVYIIENTLLGNYNHALAPIWSQIKDNMNKARKYTVLERTVDKCLRLAAELGLT